MEHEGHVSVMMLKLGSARETKCEKYYDIEKDFFTVIYKFMYFLLRIIMLYLGQLIIKGLLRPWYFVNDVSETI